MDIVAIHSDASGEINDSINWSKFYLPSSGATYNLYSTYDSGHDYAHVICKCGFR